MVVSVLAIGRKSHPEEASKTSEYGFRYIIKQLPALIESWKSLPCCILLLI